MRAAKLTLVLMALLLLSVAAALFLYYRFDVANHLSTVMPDDRAAALSIIPSAVIFMISLALCLWGFRLFRAGDGGGISGFLFLLCCASSLFQFFAVISLANTTNDTETSLSDNREMATGEASLEKPGVVRFTGTIGEGALNQILALETPEAKLRALIIDSPGGLSKDALDIARHIEANAIAVVVEELCMSSCTLIAAASNQTYARAESLFGYHDVYFSSPKESQIYNFGLQQSKIEVWTYLASRGLPADLIEKAKTHGPDSTLDLTAAEMLEKGLIKGILADDQSLPLGF
jgi:ATP-dependent protease ClpP protease subunit